MGVQWNDLSRRGFLRAAGALGAMGALAGASGVMGARVIAAEGRAAPPLVDDAWLKERLGRKGLLIVNATTPQLYAQAHIPGAVFADFGKWRVNKGEIVGLLPDVPYMEKVIGGLGITPQTHVVLVPAGFSAGDVGVATRMFWTLKTLGHDRVSILDGGIRNWARRKNPLENTPNTPRPTSYKARKVDTWLAMADDVKKALAEKRPRLIDSRTYAEFMGVYGSGSVARPGTLPGAINIPQDWLVDPQTARFLPPEKIARIHDALGDKDGEAITFCNTGHRASLGWFAREVLLGRRTRMYDGSMSEWTHLKPVSEYPVVARIDLGK